MKNPQNESHNILNIRAIIDDEKCFRTVRELRWTKGVRCAHCGSNKVVKHGGKCKSQEALEFIADLMAKSVRAQFTDAIIALQKNQ